MKTLVCTMAIGGDRRIPEVQRLVKTFKEHTDYDVVVYADNDYDYGDLNGARVVNFDNIFADVPKYFNNTFNYNLKSYVTAHAYFANPQYDRIIWTDCDVYFEKPSDLLNNMVKPDMHINKGTFPPGENLPSNRKFAMLIPELNDERLKIDEKYYQTLPYIVELLIVFIRGPQVDVFMGNWTRVAKISNDMQLSPSHECVEMALAFALTGGLTAHNYTGTGLANEGSVFFSNRGKMLPLAP